MFVSSLPGTHGCFTHFTLIVVTKEKQIMVFFCSWLPRIAWAEMTIYRLEIQKSNLRTNHKRLTRSRRLLLQAHSSQKNKSKKNCPPSWKIHFVFEHPKKPSPQKECKYSVNRNLLFISHCISRSKSKRLRGRWTKEFGTILTI